jgi:DNA polymerase III, delta'' subunit
MSEVARFLPWQTTIATQWLDQGDRYAHAWLVHGLSGIGKRHFVLAAAAALLCEAPEGRMACGTCQACRWVAAGNHPDFRRVRPEAVAAEEGEVQEETGSAAKKTLSREIRVEQIRALSGWFGTATHRGGWRVAVIYPAEALNVFTANALLKVLEEPPPRTIFLLTADAPDRLLPTIVSRCRRLALPIPGIEESIEWLVGQGVKQPEAWLSAAGGAPLRAAFMASDGESPCPGWLQRYLRALSGQGGPSEDALLQTADSLEGTDPAVWIDTLQRTFTDLSLVAVGLPPRYFPRQADLISGVAMQSSPVTLTEALKWLAGQRAVANHPLSAKLFVHSVLQYCARACRPVQRASGA